MEEKITELVHMADAKPRAALGFFPTPFYRLDRLSKALGVNLYIKRDDFTGMSLFGGNKIRKLEYILGDALEQGCDTVITYGATQSNHAMQTATACRRLGLKPILYLNAYVEPEEGDIRSNLLLDRVLGAEVHILSKGPGESNAQVEARCVNLGKARALSEEQAGHLCYDVPLGGASLIGAAAFIRGYGELLEQCLQLSVQPDDVFCATGTGSTLAGMVAGKLLLGDTARVIGIAVSKKGPDYEGRCAALGNDALDWLGSDARVTEEDFTIDREHFLPGYEQPSVAATQAIRLLARTEGLLLDPVYTGKAFAGLLEWVKSGRVAPDSNVVFWHTGGATALFAEPAIVGPLAEEA